jgi:hypothetical protein
MAGSRGSGEAVGSAALERAAVGRPRLHRADPAVEVRIAAAQPVDARDLAHEAHLHVGPRERIADHELAARQRAVDVAEVVGDLARDPRMQRRPGLAQPRHVQVQHQRQHRRAFRVVQPLLVDVVVGRGRIRLQPAAAVPAHDVVDDGARLDDRAIAVDDDRRFAQRMHRGQRRGRQPGLGVALVGLDLVGQAELLEEPQHALRARIVQVVDDDHRHGLLGRTAGFGR